jgi:hypothetical protein
VLAILKAWLKAVFVDRRVAAAFWGLIGVILTVQLPDVPEATLPEWAKLLLTMLSGWLMPRITEFFRSKDVALPGVGQGGTAASPGK